MTLDKETELLVNHAKTEEEKDKMLIVEQLRTLKEVVICTVNRLKGLQALGAGMHCQLSIVKGQR